MKTTTTTPERTQLDPDELTLSFQYRTGPIGKRIGEIMTKLDQMHAVAKAWTAVSSSFDVRASSLANAMGISLVELDRINRHLGGEYGSGWTSNCVASSVCTAGDDLWLEIQKQLRNKANET